MGESDESPEEWNYTVPASTRLSTQTSERLDRYQEQEDIGKSEALRRTIRAGLGQELDDSDEDDTTESFINQLVNNPLIMIGLFFAGLALIGDATQEFHILIAVTLAAGFLHTLSNRQHRG